MKKRAILVSILVVIALTALVWFYGYYNQKNSDNLPSLSSIVKMEEAEVNELLIGYHKTQLRTVWQEPDIINSNEDIWKIEGKVLTVSYNNKDKVVDCGLSTED